MSESIYAPPKADVEVPDTESEDFYVVSPTKFYLLSFLTLNLYYVYWFYRNWRAVKAREGVATLFVLLAICSSVLDRMANKGIGSPTTDVIGTALVLITPLVLVRGQKAINFACGDPDGSGNSRYTLANWVWMILGGLFWLLILFGVYAMVFAPELLME